MSSEDWKHTLAIIQEDLERLLARPVFLDDIFVLNFKKWRGHVSCQERGRPCEPFEFLYEGRPMQSCRPGTSVREPVTLNPNLQPLKISERVVIDGAYDSRASRNESKIVAPLRKGTFYLTHGWDWVTWDSKSDNQFRDALNIIYVLTDIEKSKDYVKKMMRERPIVAISWSAYWQNPKGYSNSLQPNSTLEVCTRGGYSLISASSVDDFLTRYMQAIPLTSKIIPYPSLNYPQ